MLHFENWNMHLHLRIQVSLPGQLLGILENEVFACKVELY